MSGLSFLTTKMLNAIKWYWYEPEHYIKSGILPREYCQLYSQLQTMREESDNNCAYDVEMDELQQRLEPAKD